MLPADEISKDTGLRSQHRTTTNFLVDLILVFTVAGDALVFLIGMIAAFFCRKQVDAFFPADLIEFQMSLMNYAGHFIFGTVLFAGLAARMGMYLPHNIVKLRRLFLAAMNSAMLWAVIYLFLSLVFSFRPSISRLFVTFSAIIGLGLIIAWRTLLVSILSRSGISRRIRQRLVIVGWNLEVDNLAKAIARDPAHPYEIIGCLPSAHNEYRMAPPPEVRQLGRYEDLSAIHKAEIIDIILIGDLDPNTQMILALSEFCQREMIQFKVVPTYFQILLSGLHLQTISGVPVLGIARLPLDRLFFRLIKRTMDIVGALIGLILSIPILIFFGIQIYRESPGPIIYRQKRMGRKGRLFDIYKLRSMNLDAEKEGPQWAQPNDIRRLKVGAFMRKWNIDEVPQFWNVLKGEMSLVGPRPERPELISDFKEQIQHYNVRHNVKPGMTGWAQIHGLRGNTNLPERLRYDLFYLENWTAVLDVYIMLVTFRRNLNAY